MKHNFPLPIGGQQRSEAASSDFSTKTDLPDTIPALEVLPTPPVVGGSADVGVDTDDSAKRDESSSRVLEDGPVQRRRSQREEEPTGTGAEAAAEEPDGVESELEAEDIRRGM